MRAKACRKPNGEDSTVKENEQEKPYWLDLWRKIPTTTTKRIDNATFHGSNTDNSRRINSKGSEEISPRKLEMNPMLIKLPSPKECVKDQSRDNKID